MSTANDKRLFFTCQQCGESVSHYIGPHLIDTGTILFCPKCDGQTLVTLSKPAPATGEGRSTDGK